MPTSFKFFIGENNIRRISVESDAPSFSEVTALLQDLYADKYHPELYLKWKDEDGDLITVSSSLEWDHMMQSMKERPIKLYVAEGNAPYFKDGPPADPRFFYTENKEEAKAEPELLERLQSSVPEFLQKLFKGERILPNHLPLWLQEAIEVKRLPGLNEVDLDVDIPKLFEAMHQRALELLNDAKNVPCIVQARQLLKEMLQLVPKHAITLYNLSCAESLLGNVKEGLETLKSAIAAGYSNFEHMMRDEDLTNVRATPEFKDLVDSLQPKEEPKAEEQPKEQPKEEQPKEQPKEEKPKEVPAVPNTIEDDWTQVEKPAEPVLSVGELKWKDAIELLRGMGFGNEEEYFGPRCVALLEKHNGDVYAVITELLR
jgi:hypothetical protein